MTPNAIKIGLTSVGGFLINKAVILIAPLYLSLSDIASYGTTKQFIDLIGALGSLWFSTYYPQITQYRVTNNLNGVKRLYIKSIIILILAFVILGFGLIMAGEPVLLFIHSKTQLLHRKEIVVFLLFAFLDVNNSLSMASLLTKNEVPFYKSFLLAGMFSVLLLILFLKTTSLGILSMILAPSIAQSVYQNWKWPLTIGKELRIQWKDIKNVFNAFVHEGLKMK
jgi:O-antigen/teichoic acid export membrane protein